MTPRRPACAAALLLLVPAVPAQPFVLEITAGRDNTIYEPVLTVGPAPLTSNGIGTRCFAGADAIGSKKRALLRFDVAGSLIPPGSSIVAAELELVLVQSLAGGPLAVHALAADWGEGQSFAPHGQGGGAAAQAGDATWLDRFSAAAPPATWTNAGGDFVAAPSASAAVSFANLPHTVTIASTPLLAADVQAWLDVPGCNFGWILLGGEAATATALAFATREDPAQAPRLRVSYTPPALAGVADTYGTAGCDPSAAKPTLEALSRPVAGTSVMLRRSPGGSGAAITALALATAAPALPIPLDGFLPAGPDCLFHVDPAAVLFFGAAPPAITLPLAAGTSLVGHDLYWQGFGIAAGPSVVVTNGLLTRIGTL